MSEIFEINLLFVYEFLIDSKGIEFFCGKFCEIFVNICYEFEYIYY